MIREMHQSDWEKLYPGLKQWIQRDVKEDAGAEWLFLLFAVLYCTLQYIKSRNKTMEKYHKQHVLPVSVILFLIDLISV